MKCYGGTGRSQWPHFLIMCCDLVRSDGVIEQRVPWCDRACGVQSHNLRNEYFSVPVLLSTIVNLLRKMIFIYLFSLSKSLIYCLLIKSVLDFVMQTLLGLKHFILRLPTPSSKHSQAPTVCHCDPPLHVSRCTHLRSHGRKNGAWP